MNTLLTIAAMVVFAALIKDTILSGRCLLLALAERRNGVTRYNYLRWGAFSILPSLYACYVFGNHRDKKDRLGKRYEDFYELFSSIKRRLQ